MPLREYRAKRDFNVTREPKPAVKKSPKAEKGAPLFVIQKHAASHLHYDFRLELGGVLRSWAVPKGPPFAHEEKRLAMQVEDHPFDYARFEGIIPAGQYGGGTVMVWDIGTWEPLSENPARDLAGGKLHFLLHGKKLKGEWRLVRIGRDDRANEWLLIRQGESLPPLSKKRDDQSVLTRRTMARIAADKNAVWNSNHNEEKTAPPKSKPTPAKKQKPSKPAPAKEPPAKPNPRTLHKLKSQFVEPMKAKLVADPPPGKWLYELKWDGYRALALRDGPTALLLSRNNKDLTQRFPDLAPALLQLPCRSAILDGEIVALDAKGRSSFQLLQDFQNHEHRPPLAYYLFDILALDGRDLTHLPLSERKDHLATLLATPSEALRLSPFLKGSYATLLAQVRKHGIEGLIGKRPDSKYEPGRRSGAWIKIKVLQEQEFVIGGYTPPAGSRHHLGALIVGYYEKGKLLCASKVGTGFTEAMLKDLHKRLQPLRIEKCPFANLPEQRKGRWGQGITKAEMAKCTWVRPRLVCQVRFTEWTRDAGLRHPAFLGLREDKAAAEVVRERAE
jgi:bifunctional non-homologous end joining protein LigD